MYILHMGYDSTDGCTTTDTIEITEYTEITSVPNEVDVDCYGDNTGSITANPVGGLAPYTYSWNTIPSQTTQTVFNLSAGSYTVMITDARGCQNTFTHTITEPDEIEVVITATNFDLSISSITGGIGPYAYEWVEEYTPGVLTTANTHTVSYNGNYSLIVTDEGAINNLFCTAESNIISFGTTGLDNLVADLKVYPNPFRSEATIDFGRVVGKSSIRLVDVYGKIIEDYRLEDTDKHIISKGDKADGIYFLEIEIEDRLYNIKLIME